MRITLRHSATYLACAAMLALACKGDDKKPETPAPTGPPPAAPPASTTAAPGTLDLSAIIGRVGVAAGGWSYAANVGAEGFLTFDKGDVAVRRVGTEEFVAVASDKRLFPGDVIRTGTGGTATVTLSDETVVELAEDTAVAVGDRDATSDPASAAAVLVGVVRFTVSERAKGEGPFLVYTPGGVIGTKGTTYAVGVSASGEARVGVEEGEVEVAGAADFEKTEDIPAGKSTTVAAEGTLGTPTDFGEDDWGDWRDGAAAGQEPEVVLDVHAARLANLETETDADYVELDKLTTDAVALNQAAAKAETDGDDAAYEAGAPERSAVIEASFVASVRLKQHTYAMLSHAYLAEQLYLRHPKRLEAKYQVARPRVIAATLYHKKYHAVVHSRVKPVRGMYYRHHPRGRVQVEYAGVALTPFHRKHKLAPVDRTLVRKRLRAAGYHPPRIKRYHKRRRLAAGPPAVGWHKETKAKPRRYRTKGAWYRPPAQRRGRLIGGVTVVGKRGRVFGVTKVSPRGSVRVHVRRPGARNPNLRIGPSGARKHRIGPGGAATHPAGPTVRRGPGGVSVKVKTPHGVTRRVQVGPRGGVKMGVRGPQGQVRKGVKVGPGGKVRAVKRPGGKVRKHGKDR